MELVSCLSRFNCKAFYVGLVIAKFCCCQEFILKPNNTAVLVGSEVVLRCTHKHSAVYWTVQRRGSIQAINSMSCSEKDSHIESVNTRGLFCNSIQLTHGGQYTCRSTMTLQSISAELIVIEAAPLCSSSLSNIGDIITFTCSLTYSGSWSPAARWQQFTETNQSLGDPVTMWVESDNFVHNKTISFEFSVNVTMSNIVTKYRCTIYFDESQRPSSVSAKNVPSYEHEWMSEVMRTSMETVTVAQSSASSASSIELISENNWSPDTAAILLGVLLGVSALVIITLVVYIIIYRRRTARSQSPERNNVGLPQPAMSTTYEGLDVTTREVSQDRATMSTTYEGLTNTTRKASQEGPVVYEEVSVDRHAESALYCNVENK